MKRRYVQLAPGVELITEGTSHFKSNLFTITLTVPLRRETATAYALIPEVLYRGSCQYPDISALSAATDNLYGASMEVGVRQLGESQCICMRCGYIDAKYTFDQSDLLIPTIELMAEILLNPLTENGVFKSAYVKSEGENLADRIRSRMNDKAEWALHRLIQEMCDGEAYAIDKLGDADEAIRLTAQDLWKYYKVLLREAKITFYYNGSADDQQVESAVRNVFGALLTPRCAAFECMVLPRSSGEVKRIREEMNVTQGKLVLGFRTSGIALGHPKFPALLVCNALYGGAGTSKLFVNVRERMGLCYSVVSIVDRLKGIMVVTAGVEHDDIEPATDEILAQLSSVGSGEINSHELTAAIRSVTGGLVGHRDSQGQMEDDAVTGFSVLGEWIDNDVLLVAVEQVTAEQVAEVARMISLDTVYSLVGE